jgi:hypothetical protein
MPDVVELSKSALFQARIARQRVLYISILYHVAVVK